jgi:UDP-N-acetyl-2-amino-2-deoxyglucuronate dehydrogenase
VEPETKDKEGHGLIIKDFPQAILEDREPFVNGKEGRASLEIANAIILSSFEEKAVSFPVDRGAYDRPLRKLSKTD